MEIAKQLIHMADSLPTIKQCMADVKAGIYKPSAQAVVASGGTVPAKIDTTTGNPVKIIIDPTKKLIAQSEVLAVPSVGADGKTTAIAATILDGTPAVTTDAAAETTTTDEKKDEKKEEEPKKEDEPKKEEETKKEEDKAQTDAETEADVDTDATVDENTLAQSNTGT